MNPNCIYLRHIITRCQKILDITSGLSYEDFVHDENIQDIVTRSFEIIGEATKGFSDEFLTKYTHVKWKDWRDFRNVMIHQYFKLDLEFIYSVIKEEVPDLLKDTTKILEEIEK